MTPTTPSPISDQAAGEPIYKLAYELDAVIIDTEQGHGFDNICLATIKRVRDALRSAAPTTGSAPVAFYDPNDGSRQESFVWASDYPNGTGSSNVPLYAAPASPAASVLSDEQIREHLAHLAKRISTKAEIVAVGRALLAASTGGGKS